LLISIRIESKMRGVVGCGCLSSSLVSR